jgi:hypothetical protein
MILRLAHAVVRENKKCKGIRSRFSEWTMFRFILNGLFNDAGNLLYSVD